MCINRRRLMKRFKQHAGLGAPQGEDALFNQLRERLLVGSSARKRPFGTLKLKEHDQQNRNADGDDDEEIS
jgi:hypothetical protein